MKVSVEKHQSGLFLHHDSYTLSLIPENEQDQKRLEELYDRQVIFVQPSFYTLSGQTHRVVWSGKR